MADQIDSRRRESNGNPFSLKELIDTIQWQRIQDDFSQITGISMRTVDSRGQFLTRISNQPKLCKLIHKTTVGHELCESCLPTFLGGKAVVDRNLSFICNAGIYCFVIPLKITDTKLVANFILGPVILVMRKDKHEYQKIAEEVGLGLDNFWDALLEIKVISFNSVRSLIALIKDIGEYVIELAYNKSGLESYISKKIKQEEWFDSIYTSNKFSKILDILLEVAFQVTGADVGSIMIYDSKKDELSIKASKGLSDEIVRNTRIKLGEGISGLVAEKRKPLILDEEVKEEPIKSLLKRPQINSSMVIPLSLKRRFLGVVNIGTKKPKAARFTQESISLVNRLIDLTGIAITNIS